MTNHARFGWSARALALAAVVVGSVSAAGQSVLRLDINDDDSGETADVNTQAGYTSFTLGQSGQAINGVTITFAAAGGGVLDDRDRATPTNAGAFTTSELLDDFIFSNSAAVGGIDITLAGLVPSQRYRVTLYAFDSGSTTGTSTENRSATYTANGAHLLDTSFRGEDAPTSDTQYAFTGEGAADGLGVLVLSGRRTGGLLNGTASPGVFVDALEVTAVPEPTGAAVLALALGAVAGRSRRRRR